MGKGSVILLLLALMCTALFLFRSGNGGTEEEARGAANEAAAAQDTVTYNIFRDFHAPEYPADGGPGKRIILEKMAEAGIEGVDYQVELAKGSYYYTKLNVKATAGDLPDLFHVDYPTFIRLAQEGKLLRLNEYLEQSPNIRGMIDPSKLDDVTVDGGIYAIPTGTRPEPYNVESRAGFVVRQDWLDRLGLERPRNLDEMHAVLQAFTYGDPDGNGRNDTYGYGAEKSHQFAGIFGAFGIHPDFWHERDGRIRKGFTMPEAKEALAVLQQWYKEGLIDPRYPVTDTKQRDDHIIQSKYGMFQNAPLETDPSSAMYAALLKRTPDARLSFFTGVKGPEGKSGFPETSPYTGLRAVSADVKQPDKLFRMLDWMQSDEGGFYLIHYGVEGEDFVLDRETNRIRLLSAYSELYRKGFSNPVRFLNDIDIRWADDAVKAHAVEAAQHSIRNELWEPVPAEQEYPNLDELWDHYFTNIVIGEYELEKWDEFVKLYYEQGGERIERQANEEWREG